MRFHNDVNASRVAVDGIKSEGSTRTLRSARVCVEPLEGRRLMDAGGSAGLNLTAHADVQVVAKEQINATATYNTLRDQVTVKEQAVLSTIHASEQALANLAAKETLMLKQSVQSGDTAAAAVHAKVIVQVNTGLAQMKAAEGVVINASVAAQARARAQFTATTRLLGQAAATAQAEAAEAVKGLTREASALHATVNQEVNAAEQSRVTLQASVGASVQGVGRFASIVTQQLVEDVAAAQQLEATIQASGSTRPASAGSAGFASEPPRRRALRPGRPRHCRAHELPARGPGEGLGDVIKPRGGRASGQKGAMNVYRPSTSRKTRSTCPMVDVVTFPKRGPRRSLETDRTCSAMIRLGLVSPPSGGLTGTCVGKPRCVPVTGMTTTRPRAAVQGVVGDDQRGSAAGLLAADGGVEVDPPDFTPERAFDAS